MTGVENSSKSMSNGTKSLSRTSTILRSEAVKTSLGEQIMARVPEREGFTGQVTVEVHLLEGQVKDVFMTKRSKVKNE